MVGLKAFGKLCEISSTSRSSTFEFIDPPLAPHLTKAKGPARFMYKLFNEPNTIKYEYRYLTEKLQSSVFIFLLENRFNTLNITHLCMIPESNNELIRWSGQFGVCGGVGGATQNFRCPQKPATVIIFPRTRSFVVVRMLQRGVLIWGSDSCTDETSGCCGLVRRFVASSCTWNWPKPDLGCGVTGTLGALEIAIE